MQSHCDAYRQPSLNCKLKLVTGQALDFLISKRGCRLTLSTNSHAAPMPFLKTATRTKMEGAALFASEHTIFCDQLGS
jgi:hypothetical protein